MPVGPQIYFLPLRLWSRVRNNQAGMGIFRSLRRRKIRAAVILKFGLTRLTIREALAFCTFDGERSTFPIVKP